MKKPLIVHLLIIVLLVFGFPSCQDDCGDLGGPYYYDVVVKGYELNYVQEIVRDQKMCAKYNYSSQETNCFIPYRGGFVFAKDSLQLFITPVIEQKMAAIAPASPARRWGIIPAAYACSPIEIPRLNQRLEEVFISSSEDYTSEYPAGSNLVALFSIYTDERGFVPLANVLQQNPSLLLMEDNSLLTFHVGPENQKAHVLTFELSLNDTSFVFKTDTLRLK